ncbi:spore germination protein [Tuberibacillus sp. Marseille-P3662]|uniref:spore germination protein n=1 Tax=Tuberibacillus sp. Marseille-P3662 TaxID=1965358 RepID=UPI000A1C959B|nr:spore germination protein [Tuberibacillus sp. Marseille-P3662]
MPGFVGAVKINTLSGGSVFNIGDTYRVAPSSASKSFAGAGSFNTGDHIHTETNQNQTQTYDSDVFDQNI